jgi:hypothetical protein
MESMVSVSISIWNEVLQMYLMVFLELVWQKVKKGTLQQCMFEYLNYYLL